MMKKLRSLMVGGLALALAVALVAGACAPAAAEAKKEVRIAVLYSITGASHRLDQR
jgi:ABC-type sugar transport system substrate-binding protein